MATSPIPRVYIAPLYERVLNRLLGRDVASATIISLLPFQWGLGWGCDGMAFSASVSELYLPKTLYRILSDGSDVTTVQPFNVLSKDDVKRLGRQNWNC